MKTNEFLEQLKHDGIVEAIKQAERKTSGEIRVFVSHRKPADPVEAAKAEFEKLGMTKTVERNGVLIYLAPLVQSFAVIGDTGIHEKCGDAFWAALADEMTGHFKKSEFQQGLLHAIGKAGDLLAVHFPRRSDDRNELSDAVMTDEK